MTRHAADFAIHTGADRHPPDDFAEDVRCAMSNHGSQDTNVPGTIFVSTALGSHGPRVKWYPGRAGHALPCLIVSIGADPRIREDFVRPPAYRAAARWSSRGCAKTMPRCWISGRTTHLGIAARSRLSSIACTSFREARSDGGSR